MFPRTKLSTNFYAHEFACQGQGCCCHNAVSVDPQLIEILQEFRDALTDHCRGQGGAFRKRARVKVSSGFRCDTHNASEGVGGYRGSQHRLGRAADVTGAEIRSELVKWAGVMAHILQKHLPEGVGNIIYYPNRTTPFIHVDTGPRYSGRPPVWKKED